MEIMAGITIILCLGVLAQWLAWRLQIPSIILLLLFGLLIGPIAGILDPDALFGDLLPAFVSLGVALILFEGGLQLRIGELKHTGDIVRNLITIGVAVTWILASILAYFLLDLSLLLCALLGAILVVSGPTVIGPLLRHVRLPPNTDSTLEWESILIDPIGALLAVLVFEVIITSKTLASGTMFFILGMVKMLGIGAFFGLVGGYVLSRVIRRFWIPDYLYNPFSLALVLVVFTLSNMFAHESGLLATTVMGIMVGNQKSISLRDIIEFKEDLRVLIISVLFIVLTARLTIDDLEYLNAKTVLFIILLILVVRPVAVALSAIGSRLHLKERIYVSFMAPRGIVAAAVSSIFALRLVDNGYPLADHLVPLTFFVIIVTVIFYSVIAAPLARILDIAEPHPKGFLIIGAHLLARKVAIALHDAGCRLLLVDSQRSNVKAARLAGLPCYYGNVFTDKVRLCGIGRLLALSPNDELNALVVLHYLKVFDHMEVYQLPPDGEEVHSDDVLPRHLRGRYLFDKRASFSYLYGRLLGRSLVKTVKITDNFTYQDFTEHYEQSDIPLFVIDASENVTPITTDAAFNLGPGHTIIALVRGKEGDSSPATVSRPQQPDYECRTPS